MGLLAERKLTALDSLIENAIQEFTTHDNDRPLMAATAFVDKMESRGIIMPEHEQHYALTIANKMADTSFMEKPSVYSVPCGYGKSTLLETFLQTMLHLETTFGAIVVKSKREDVKALTETLNNESIVGNPLLKRKHRRAVSLLGQSSDEMTFSAYRAQFAEMKSANVLVMTAEMFSRYANSRSLGDLRDFEVNGRCYTRQFLFIDERPKFFVTHRLTAESVSKAISNVKAMSQELYRKDRRYYITFYEQAKRLREELEKPRKDNGQFLINAINPRWSVPDQLRRDWFHHHSDTDLDILGAIEDAVKWGGIAYTSANGTVLEVANRVSYDWTKYKTHILDATAASDPFYNDNDFEFLTFGDAVNYKNVKLLVHKSTNLSRGYFERNPDALEAAIKEAKRIIVKHSKTLVVVYKQYYEKAQELLEKEISEGMVYLHYFDGGRSTNEFRDADAVISLGWNRKHPAYYPAVTSAIEGDTVSPKSEQDLILGGKYEDDRANEVRKWDTVTDTTQLIHRARPFSNKEKVVSVYLFNRDESLLESIADQFPGATIVDYEPREKLSGKRTQADILINFFEDMEPGAAYNVSELSRETDIPRTTINKSLKTDRVKNVIKQLNIFKNGRKYRKKAS